MELLAKDQDQAKTSEDLIAREAAVKERPFVGLVLEIQGVRVRAADLMVNQIEHARLKHLVTVQQGFPEKDGSSRSESDSKGSSKGKSWRDWYEKLHPFQKFIYNLVLLYILKKLIAMSPPSLPGVGSKINNVYIVGRTTVEEFVNWILKEETEFMANLIKRIHELEQNGDDRTH